MGVSGINGPGFIPESSAVARAPSSRPRNTGPDEGAAPTARADPKTNEDVVRETAKRPQEDTGVQRTGTKLRVDEASKQIVAQIVNANNEVIKQIPPEELLKIAARFRELRGKLFDVKI